MPDNDQNERPRTTEASEYKSFSHERPEPKTLPPTERPAPKQSNTPPPSETQPKTDK
jgi:hypothetical protein